MYNYWLNLIDKREKIQRRKFKLLKAARRRAQESPRYITHGKDCTPGSPCRQNRTDPEPYMFWGCKRLKEVREMWFVHNSAGRTFHVRKAGMKNKHSSIAARWPGRTDNIRVLYRRSFAGQSFAAETISALVGTLVVPRMWVLGKWLREK